MQQRKQQQQRQRRGQPTGTHFWPRCLREKFKWFWECENVRINMFRPDNLTASCGQRNVSDVIGCPVRKQIRSIRVRTQTIANKQIVTVVERVETRRLRNYLFATQSEVWDNMNHLIGIAIEPLLVTVIVTECRACHILFVAYAQSNVNIIMMLICLFVE